ncbi:hypothetical protein HKX48_007809, partial [Thoreauomyces humboldtii]
PSPTPSSPGPELPNSARHRLPDRRQRSLPRRPSSRTMRLRAWQPSSSWREPCASTEKTVLARSRSTIILQHRS